MHAEASLDGRTVGLTVSEPWEAGSDRVDGRIARSTGSSSASEDERIEVALDEPLSYHGKEYGSLILEPRDGASLVDALERGESGEVAFYGVPIGVSVDDEPPQTWWRGGLAGYAAATLL